MKNFLLTAIIIATALTVSSQENEIVFTNAPERLGSNINTDYVESDTRISPDGKTLYFIRWEHPDNMGDGTSETDIYYSELDQNGEWKQAKNLGKPFNDDEFNMVVGIRPDGNAMITRAKYNEEKNTNLYISYKKNGKWQDLQPMEFEDLDYKISDRGYTISADFKTLIFSDMGERDGNISDLYVCFLQDNGKWSKPIRTGGVINTEQYEEWPTLANDNETLYFTSTGHGGFGKGDIFISRRLDDSWTSWSEPVNLGEKINSENYDADFVVDTQGKYAYLSKNSDVTGTMDLFRILLSEAAKPKPVILVKGNVYDKTTNEPMEVEVVYHNLSTGKQLGSAYSDASTGGYKIVLPYGEKYGIRAEEKGYIAVSENLDLTAENKNLDENLSYQELTQDLILVPLQTGSVVLINNLFFETGSSVINKNSYTDLNNLAKMLKENPKMKIEIMGHTDNVGSEANNQKLSEARANSVKKFLTDKEIKADRLRAVGYGEAKPTTSNSTAEGRKKNRRVEFKIIEQ